MNPITNAERDRREAEAWLARTLRWERTLDALRAGPDAEVAARADEAEPRPEAA